MFCLISQTPLAQKVSTGSKGLEGQSDNDPHPSKPNGKKRSNTNTEGETQGKNLDKKRVRRKLQRLKKKGKKTTEEKNNKQNNQTKAKSTHKRQSTAPPRSDYKRVTHT